MIPELGNFALMLALALSLGLAIFPALGVRTQNVVFMRTGSSLSLGIFFFMLGSFFCLLYAFVNDDFTVTYVANNSNTALPLPYKISAIWGAHEGSFLLWTLIMSGWTLAVAIFNRSLTTDITARVLAVLGGLNVGFLAFLLFTPPLVLLISTLSFQSGFSPINTKNNGVFFSEYFDVKDLNLINDKKVIAFDDGKWTFATYASKSDNLEEALYLANICKSVTLIHRRNVLRGSKIMQKRVMGHFWVEKKFIALLKLR